MVNYEAFEASKKSGKKGIEISKSPGLPETVNEKIYHVPELKPPFDKPLVVGEQNKSQIKIKKSPGTPHI